MTSGSGFGGRLLASFPTDIRAGGGIGVSKAGLATRVSIDMRNTQRLTTLPLGGLVPVQDPLTGLVGGLPVSALPLAQTGDGTQTNAKLAAMPARTIKANLLNTTAPPQDVSLFQLREALGITDGGGSVATTAANVSVIPPGGQSYTTVQGAITSIEGRVGTGGGGSVTASQISDASTSGKSVLTGTPAQGKTALQIAFGTVAGTFVEGNDARLSAVSNPVYDRGATGGRARSFTEYAADGINLFEFVTPAMLAGNIGVSAAMNAAAARCRAEGRLVVHVPDFAGTLLVDGPIDNSGVLFRGNGSQTTIANHFKVTGDFDAFVTPNPSAGVIGLRVEHAGNGRIVYYPNSLNYTVRDNNFFASNTSATQPVIEIGGSNCYIEFNLINNMRTAGWAIACNRGANDIMINNRIHGNYFGGTGRGIGVYSTGVYTASGVWGQAGVPRARQEGMEVSNNQSVITGGPLLDIQAIGNLRIINNMIDQAPARGGIAFEPTGTSAELGIYGVEIAFNYIATAGDIANGSGIRHFPSTNSVSGVQVIGNEMCFSRDAAYFGAGMGEVTFTGNYIHGMSSQCAVRCTTADIAAKVRYSKDNITVVAYELFVEQGFIQGQFKRFSTVSTSTNDGNWGNNNNGGRSRFILIPHGLGATPNLDTVQLRVRPTNGDIYETAMIYLLSADAQNVTAKITIINLVAEGSLTVTMVCANDPKNA